MASLGTLSVDIGAKTQGFTSALSNAAARAAEFAKSTGASFDRVSNQAQGMASGIGQMFAAIQVSNFIDRAARSVLSLGKAIINSAADAELMVAQMEALTGNVGQGKVLFDQLERFAARTSFTLQGAADASRNLLAKGVAQNDLIPTMQMLGDLAMGNEERLGFLAKAYTDVQAKGRLMAQEQNQFAENGINLFELLAQTTGKNTVELMAMREAGQITFDMVQQGLIAATGQGGRFFGFMQKANATFIGQWNSLMENLQSIGRMLGEMVLPTLTSIVTEANKLLDAFNAMPDRAEFAGQVLEAALDLAIAYIKNQWDDLLVSMVKGAAEAGGLISKVLNPTTAISGGIQAGKFIANLMQREGAQNVEAARQRLGDLIAQLQNGAPNAMAAPLQPKPLPPPPPPKVDVAKAYRELFDGILPVGERIAADATKLINDATMRGAFAINQIGKLFGFGTARGSQPEQVQPSQRTEFAAAAMRGSAEAYSMILSAMKGEKDPVVKATKEQTQELKKPLLDMVGLIKGGSPIKLLGSFLE